MIDYENKNKKKSKMVTQIKYFPRLEIYMLFTNNYLTFNVLFIWTW